MYKATMRDVATQAGVSISTVSHVINKTRFVESVTEKKVWKAVEKLKYRPNILARSLKGKGTKTLGVIISDIRDTFFSDAVKSIESRANEQGYNVILCDAEGSYEKEASYIDILLRKGVDGLIFAPVDREGGYEDLIGKRIPSVQMDRKTSSFSTDFVGIDNVKGARQATRHLIEHGYRNIGFVGYERRYYTMEMRLKGYESALRDRGLAAKPLITSRGHGGKIIRNEVMGWLSKENVDAVLCGNDDICFETLLAIRELGLSVPGQMGIVTFDDVKWLQLLKWPISAVRQPAGQIGSLSFEILFERISSGSVTEPRTVLLDPELVVRSSCGVHHRT